MFTLADLPSTIPENHIVKGERPQSDPNLAAKSMQPDHYT